MSKDEKSHVEDQVAEEKRKMLAMCAEIKVRDLRQRLDLMVDMERKPVCHLRQTGRQDSYFVHLICRDELPIRNKEVTLKFIEAWDDCKILILKSGPGSGKSTQVPQFVLNDMIIRDRKDLVRVACAQPSTSRARGLACRVAKEMDLEHSGILAYMVKGADSVTDASLITYITDEALLEKVYWDRAVIGGKYGVVIVDEVHERTAATDMLLSLLKEELLREGSTLKVIVMSATLDMDTFEHYFQACGVKALTLSEQTPRHVETRFLQEPCKDLLSAAMTLVRQGVLDRRGNMLVLLPDEFNVRRLGKSWQKDSRGGPVSHHGQGNADIC